MGKLCCDIRYFDHVVIKVFFTSKEKKGSDITFSLTYCYAGDEGKQDE